MEFAISDSLCSIGGLSDVTDGDADKYLIEILNILKKYSSENY